MKKFIVPIVCTVLALMPMTFVRGDLVTQYGVDINDEKLHEDAYSLFNLFNSYFADQLGTDGLYASSNDLFNERGVDPYANWTTSGSQLVCAFKVAAFGHEMSMVDTATGSVIDSLYHIGGTVNIGEVGGITDLSGQSVTDIPDGLSVSFRLDAYWGDNVFYSWSSNPNDNVDGMIHMVALDVTDLYNDKWGTANTSVYMFGWEDLHLYVNDGAWASDWDYQDFVVMMTNVTPDGTPVVPEPGTMLVFGAGLVGLGLGYRRKFKKS